MVRGAISEGPPCTKPCSRILANLVVPGDPATAENPWREEPLLETYASRFSELYLVSIGYCVGFKPRTRFT